MLGRWHAPIAILARILAAALLTGSPDNSASGSQSADSADYERSRYLHVLEVWASGDEARAVRLLVELEEDIDSRLATDGAQAFRAMILKVAEDLARLDPNLLLPLTDLQLRCYLDHWTSGFWDLAFRSRTTAYQLADRYADAVHGPDQRELAGSLFAALAGYFHQSSSLRTATQLYLRSLKFDSRQESALLGLATLYEQKADYSRAFDLLERLVESHPNNLEAQLRRAVNLGRQGGARESAELLAQIASNERPEWVVVLAFHELSRHYLNLGSVEQAFEWVSRGLERFPADESLTITRIYLRERLGLDPVALDLVQKMNRCAESWMPSARYRYAQLQGDIPEKPHARLRSKSEALRATLYEGLLKESSPKRN